MIKTIKVIEKCEVDFINENDEPLKDGEVRYALREVFYPTYYETLVLALIDYVDNFNVNKIMSYDNKFSGTCLYREVVGIEFSDRYNEEYLKEFIDGLYRGL